jgi:hypothetical protein
MQQLESRCEALASQLDAAAADASTAQRHADRQTAQAAALLSRLEEAQHDARGAEAAACGEQQRSQELQLGATRQMQALEARVRGAIRQAQDAEQERRTLQAAVAAAEVRGHTAP